MYVVVRIAVNSQPFHELPGNSSRLPGIWNDIRKTARKPGYAKRLVDEQFPLRVIDGGGVANIYGGGYSRLARFPKLLCGSGASIAPQSMAGSMCRW